MKRTIIITVLFVIEFTAGNAQTPEEWTQQKATQKKYLLQQIAALGLYLNYAEKGYQIAREGLNTIQHIKKGDFDLHDHFFSSLSKVNPAIKKYTKTSKVILYQTRILKIAKQSLDAISASDQLTPEEIDYCKRVFDFLLTECFETIEELLSVITDSNWQMNDNERLKRIDKIYSTIQNQFAFSSSFRDEIHLLTTQRKFEQADIHLSKGINAVK